MDVDFGWLHHIPNPSPSVMEENHWELVAWGFNGPDVLHAI